MIQGIVRLEYASAARQACVEVAIWISRWRWKNTVACIFLSVICALIQAEASSAMLIAAIGRVGLLQHCAGGLCAFPALPLYNHACALFRPYSIRDGRAAKRTSFEGDSCAGLEAQILAWRRIEVVWGSSIPAECGERRGSCWHVHWSLLNGPTPERPETIPSEA